MSRNSMRYIRDPWLEQVSLLDEERLSAELELTPIWCCPQHGARRLCAAPGHSLQGRGREVLPLYPSRSSSPWSSSSSGSSSGGENYDLDKSESVRAPLRFKEDARNDSCSDLEELACKIHDSLVFQPGSKTPVARLGGAQPRLARPQQSHSFDRISPQTAGAVSHPTAPATFRKRDNEDIGEGVFISKRSRTHPPVEPDRTHETLRFACPLQAMFPRLHCFSPPTNPQGGCPTISKLTDHVRQQHDPTNACLLCGAMFKSAEKLVAMRRQDIRKQKEDHRAICPGQACDQKQACSTLLTPEQFAAFQHFCKTTLLNKNLPDDEKVTLMFVAIWPNIPGSQAKNMIYYDLEEHIEDWRREVRESKNSRQENEENLHVGHPGLSPGWQVATGQSIPVARDALLRTMRMPALPQHKQTLSPMYSPSGFTQSPSSLNSRISSRMQSTPSDLSRNPSFESFDTSSFCLSNSVGSVSRASLESTSGLYMRRGLQSREDKQRAKTEIGMLIEKLRAQYRELDDDDVESGRDGHHRMAMVSPFEAVEGASISLIMENASEALDLSLAGGDCELGDMSAMATCGDFSPEAARGISAIGGDFSPEDWLAMHNIPREIAEDEPRLVMG